MDKPDTDEQDEPQVFSVKKVGGSWTLSRRDFLKSSAAGTLKSSASGAVLAAAAITSESTSAAEGKKFYAHSGAVMSLAITGNQLISTGKDKKIKIWAVPVASLERTAPDIHSDEINAIAAGPQASFFVTGGSDKKLVLWQASLKENIKTLTTEDKIDAVAVSPDGLFIATTGATDVRLYRTKVTDTSPLGLIFDSSYKLKSTVKSLVFTNVSNQFWCGCADGSLHIFDPASKDKKAIKQLNEHNGIVRSLSFSDHHQLVASAGADQLVRLWDAKTYSVLSSFKTHSNDIRAVVFSESGKQLACGSWDDTASVWNINGPHRKHLLQGHTGDVNALVFSDDEHYLYTASDDKSIIQWDLTTGKAITRMVDLKATPKEAKGVTYKITSGTTTTTYTLPCGSPIPAGAVCTCNCVPGSWSAPSTTRTRPSTRTYTYHYWYPN